MDTNPPLSHMHTRRVRFADTDAAGIAWTGRIVEFALDAIDSWFRARLDTDWYELNIDQDVGTPFVRVAVEFRSPLTPRDTLGTEVRVAMIGRSSLTFAIAGRVGERLIYEGELTCVFVTRSTGRSIPIPEVYRAKLA